MSYAYCLTSTTRSKTSFFLERRPTQSGTRGEYSASSTDFINSFYAVLRRWRSETAIYSDPDKITSHPSFLAMVQNADLITPLIIEELRQSPSQLVWVLDDAYGEQPYAPNSTGNIREMTNAWIAWAERNGRVL